MRKQDRVLTASVLLVSVGAPIFNDARTFHLRRLNTLACALLTCRTVRIVDMAAGRGSDTYSEAFSCPKWLSGNHLSEIPCLATILTC